MKKELAILLVCFLFLPLCGCGQLIADAMFSDQYLKPVSKSQVISANSQREAIKAAITAARDNEWTPITISTETGYILAEYIADPKLTRGKRDYTFKLEIQIPDNGRGEVNITIIPPHGLLSTKSMEEAADEFFASLEKELATTSQ